MKLSCGDRGNEYEFFRVALVFEGRLYQDVFAHKNNKTVGQTLEHRHYAKLKKEIIDRYSDSLGMPLGEFLKELKYAGDSFYKRFLNKYGDLTYSIFKIADAACLESKGVYAYLAGDELMYIGRCKDSMRKRVNQGYGKIHPKNCYLDGQATNCRLNAGITAQANEITLWLHEMESEAEIEFLERELIRAYNPPWNMQRG